MGSVTADRRLVKSPPELWAEVSDPEALARHLGELGEIRITRVQPETEVAWEAERASGTIEIETSGWGTRVLLSAAPAAAPEPEPPPPAPAPDRVETELRIVAQEVIPIEVPAPAPEPPAAPERPAEAETASPALPAEPPPRPGFLARWFGRRPVVEASAPPEPAPAPEPPSPPDPEPPPSPEVVELRVVHVACASRVPERPVPEPPPPAADGLEPEALREVLDRVLDDLGAAHHRPFSRG